jgi:RHH-type proline utilization regulon transcriptional repressor/proline dehydrogenase/delta 1-pyrroline-5-carboxylate dehydrogenase
MPGTSEENASVATVMVDRNSSDSALERRTQEIGRRLFARIGRGPAPWSRAWWDARLMDLTLGDPEVKVQLFRFIDAMPAMMTAESVRRHLAEYLTEAGPRVPRWLWMALRLAPRGSPAVAVLAWVARRSAGHMAHRFIAGETPAQALETVRRLRGQRLAFTADLLGEAVISEAEAEIYQQTCLDLLRGLAGPLAEEPEIAQLDRDQHGPIPRANLSLKLTSLTARFDALHAETTFDRVAARLRPILRAARTVGAYVHVDMEQYAHKDLALAIFHKVLYEPEFRDWPDVGIVVQAYLPETEEDLRDLDAWVERRGTPVTVRLVKGAYWDYEVVHARQVGWPEPVFLRKWESDASYERCARFLMERHDRLRPALASHNVRSLAAGLAAAEMHDVPPLGYEVQMLHGMGEPIQRALVEGGHRVRVYTPYGALLPGMAYLVRRLLENTSNDSFLKASFTAHARVDDLLRDPEEVGAMWGRGPGARRWTGGPGTGAGADGDRPARPLAPFANEPPTDFTRAENRERFRAALAEVRGALGRSYPLVLKDQEQETAETFASYDPGDASRLIGWFPRAGAREAGRAVAIAREAFPAWSSTTAEARAAVLIRAAAILRRRKFTLAAWEVYECGKPWREADADIAEAIDFCEFYAREMIRLAVPWRRDVPGETNASAPLARGVAVVVPPWNFPLAIPTGMTAAALVAGNTVVLKPSERAPMIVHQLAAVLAEAGLPPGVLTVLPGFGDAGAALVGDPRVDLIAFTGSRDVGLEINRRAAEPLSGQDHVKRVIAEMGGKNAVIVDDDADLDEAVVGVLQSAFGYAGQKCSACSRAIVLDAIHDAFLARLVEAARALTVGPADDPETFVGPVIDARARQRVEEYIRIAASEGQVVLATDVGPLAERGNFVGPHIVAGVGPDARIAQEEVFGPVLAVLRARDLEDALAIAGGTAYALTGGVYSRSPAHIERVRREFRVGNLYINRPITGALVDRQPFGGFKLSGIGTKAGGPDYLREFLLTRTVTENTMRRGFAPDEVIEGPGKTSALPVIPADGAR